MPEGTAHGCAMLWLLSLAAAGPDLGEAARREVARQECRLRDEGADVTVCGRREQKNRYQVTDPTAPYDPGGNVKGAMTERMGWIAEGDSGIGSCSNIGPSAGTGCFEKAWRRTLQQKGWLVR
ncbi:hypothetical protein GCM10022211_09510 [Sphingomonas humi]|uniref:Uncharacterized protein n=2 Tax=Sphingomonas humi TaxID=335630 RepID=A0ABP7RQU0_9SPHN